jgi:hypothetical protein
MESTEHRIFLILEKNRKELDRVHAILDALLRCDDIQRDLLRHRSKFTDTEKQFLDGEIEKLKRSQDHVVDR